MTTTRKLNTLPPIPDERIAELALMPDEDIDYSDIPELDDEFFKNARVVYPNDDDKAS